MKRKNKRREENCTYHGRWLDPADPRVYRADGLVDFREGDGVLGRLFLVVTVARGGCHDDRYLVEVRQSGTDSKRILH